MFGKLADKAKDAFYLNAGMYIESNKAVTLENCTRIEEYNEVFVQVVSGSLIIQIWGNNLRSYDFNTGGLMVRGKINRIEFSERGKNKNENKTLSESECEGK